MIWTEKRPKGPNANLVELARGSWEARVRLRLPDGRAFERERTCGTKTEARRLRDEMYGAFNALALVSASGQAQRAADWLLGKTPLAL